ncbi:MAG: HDOD domain-containing protein [bacterium]|nr:HDOD domain-containing protein [bacterium]
METFIARQPIFDIKMQVIGYELLHRSGWNAAFDGSDPDRATLELLNNSLLVNRLEDLTDGKLGFVNVTENLLQQDVIQILPPEHTVVEVLETVRPTPEVVQAVRALKDAGHKIALDDFEETPAHAPLIEIADFIKIDFSLTKADERRAIVDRLSRKGLTFLAEKIETREEYEQSAEDGYELFQGFFFCKPQTSSRKDIPRSKVNCMQLISEVSRPQLELDKIEDLIKREVSLSAKLLQYLNSVHFGLEHEIHSIRQALVHLGERPLKRWAMLVGMAGLGQDGPVELVRTCLVRARFLEQLAGALRRPDGALDLFLVGMFSTLDALTGKPLRKALAEIGVKGEVADAIQGSDSWLGKSFALAMASERGDVVNYTRIAKELDLLETDVANVYAESLFWADSVFSNRLTGAA